MTKIFTSIIALSAMFLPLQALSADDQSSFEGYLCQSFLDDITQKSDGEKLWRSTMLIAWGAGYASAFQNASLRVDLKSMRLIGAALGAACKEKPNEVAVKVFVGSINRLLATGN